MLRAQNLDFSPTRFHEDPFFQYIRDRVSGARQMPSLADLIKQRADTMDLGRRDGID
jgi:hypothetical protein